MKFLLNHWGAIGVGLYILFIAHAQAMYAPSKEPSAYGYFYRFCLALVPMIPAPKVVVKDSPIPMPIPHDPNIQVGPHVG